MKLPKIPIEITVTFLACWAFVATLSYIAYTAHTAKDFYENGCKPKSIMQMVNIPVRVGCELIKERDW